MENNWTLELRQSPIIFGLYGHYYWVKRDNQGNWKGEIQGLPSIYNNETKKWEIGQGLYGDTLRGYSVSQPRYKDIDDHVVVYQYQGEKTDIEARFSAAENSIEYLNNKNITYQPWLPHSSEEQNSNAYAYTLGQVMDLPNLDSINAPLTAPGWGYDILFDFDNLEDVNDYIFDENGFFVKISEKNAEGEIVKEYSGTYDSATGIFNLNGEAVDANGNPIGEWETEIVGIAPESGTVVSKTAKTTPDGELIGPWETKVEVSEEYAQSIINEAVRNTEGAFIGNEIGELFGSSLGQVIAGDNIFAQIGSQTALSTVLGNVGQSIGAFLENGFDLLQGVESAFEDFSKDLFKNLQSTSISAVSSFLTAELSDVLDIPGDFGGQLLESYIGTEVSNIANAVIGLDFSPWNPATFIGSYLAKQVVSPQTTAGAIGGSIGGTIGTSLGIGLSAIGAEIGFLGSLGSTILGTVGLQGALASWGLFGNILLPGVGAFIGVALGTLLGDTLAPFISKIADDVFGQDPPRADAWMDYDPLLGQFISDPTGRRQEKGQRETAVEIAKFASDALNAYVEGIDGEIINQESLRESFRIWQDKKSPFLIEGKGFKTAQEQLEYGVLSKLRELEIAGGDIFAKRVLQNSQAETLEELSGDFQIAQDYGRYLENKDVIDLLIATEPNSAFSAGWVITLIRAEELGLTEWSASDFQGGLASFFDSIGLDDIGVTPDDVAISIDGTTLNLDIIVDGQVVSNIEIEDFANKINYQHLATSADGSVVTGIDGNDIWIAGNKSSTFVDAKTATGNSSNDILIGSNFADTINGGAGRDFIRGNGGNDLLIGSSNNDLIYGNDGDDTIHGDENNGFAPIPTEGELSDAAKSDAPPAFDGVRRTWFGGTEIPEIELSRNYTPPKPDFNEDELHGGAGNDQIAGGAGEDKLYGDAGADTLYGDEGDDYLVGGAGADVIYGGVGFDVASYQDATQGVTVDLAGDENYGTASDGDRLYSIEDLVGSSFDDKLSGDAYANIIDGGMGSDNIDGRDGRDTVSFFTSAFGVEINMNTGKAVTKTGEKSTETDTLLNIEDAIASTHDDTLIGSTQGGGLDGDAGNDTIIIDHDDVDVANKAATYDVRGGEGIDTLSFATWDKSRGVEINLNGSENGNSFNSIEKVIGSTLADSITGAATAEIFDGGKGNDVFTVSEGRDVYLLNRGSNNDQLHQIVVQTDVNQTSNHGNIKVNNDLYRQLYPGLNNRKVELKVNYKDSVNYGVPPKEDDESISQQQSIVLGEDVTYHDIFGSLKALDPNSIDLAYEKYFTTGYPSDSKIITKQELIDLLDSIDLTIGIKPENSYITNLSKLTDTITIQGGGLLPNKDSKNLSWTGFLEEGYSTKRHKKTFSDDTFTVTHQGTQYNFGTNQPIERLGFADSGHIELGQIKYFQDGSADVDTLVADTDKATWLYGGDANDTIKGGEQADVLIGGKKNDLLQGNGGDDQYAYWLGDGYDIIDDQLGIDTIVFGGGITANDIKLKVGKLDDATNYTSFKEILPGEVSPDLNIEIYNPETAALTGSITVIDFQDLTNFKDKLRFAGDYEVSIFELLEQSGDPLLPTFTGTSANDTLTGTEAGEAFWGLAGNDTMRGNDGDDVFFAHGGADSIDGGNGSDTLDYRYATDAVNINLSTKRVTESGDLIDKFNSIENAVGSDFNDTIIGNSSDNILVGGAGNDAINGDKGNDILIGDAGDDLLNGGLGNDTLTGGAGRDRFGFSRASDGIDTITDFTVADDLIEISAAGFNKYLPVGQLDIGQFILGSQASTSAHRFIYNDTNGDLLFDSDGNGKISAAKFATLAPNLALTHENFVVV
ncbi:calcium-binding protein [Halotia wernerae UHCC 0503]|nr:calcium-binding protein [Halotia wernerae UHCC 0503]